MKNLLLIFAIFIFNFINFAQTGKIDSLRKAFNDSDNVEWKLHYCNKLQDEFSTINFDSTYHYVKIGVDLLKNIKKNSIIINQLINTSIFWVQQSKTDTAIFYIKRAIDLSKKEKNDTLLHKALNLYSYINILTGNYDIAKKNLFEAVNVSNQKINILKSYSYIGIVYFYQARFDSAITFFYKASKLDSSDNQIKNKIAACLLRNKEINKAKQIFIQIINDENSNDFQAKLSAMNNLGFVYMKAEVLDSALIFYKKSYELSKKLKYTSSMLTAINNISEIYLKKKDFYNSEKYFDTTVILAKKYNDVRILAIAYNDMEKLFYDNHKYEKSKNIAIEALKYAEKMNNNLFLADAYKYLAKSNEKLNNYKKALEYYKKYKALNDSVFNEEKHKTITEIETKYETEKKEQKIKEQENLLKLQQTENKLKSMEIKRQKAQKYYFGVGFVLLLLVLIFIIRAYKQKRKNLELKLEKEAISASLKGQEQEREKIAEELHDDIGGLLAGLNMLLSRIIKENKDIKELPQISEKLNQTYKYIRLTSHQLAHFSKLNKTLLEGVEEFIDSVQHTQSAVITYKNNLNIDINNINEQLKIDIYRTIQELVINAIKHSKAENITLLLSNDKNNLNIVVLDDGKGFAENEKHGIGLNNIKQRLKSLNGEIEIESIEGEGTTIKVKIPVF